MSDLLRFGTSAKEKFLQNFDCLIAAQGYSNRSEALRDLMPDTMVKSRIRSRAGNELPTPRICANTK